MPTLTVKPCGVATALKARTKHAAADLCRGVLARCVDCGGPWMFYSWPASRKGFPVTVPCACGSPLYVPEQTPLEFVAGDPIAGHIAAARRDLEARQRAGTLVNPPASAPAEPAEPEPARTCTKCCEERPAAEFGASSRAGGRQPWCRACKRSYDALRRRERYAQRRAAENAREGIE